MIVAVTGATGFIGSHIVAALKAGGHRVRALTRPTSRREHIADYLDDVVEGQQDDPQAQFRLVQGVDAVVHNAYDWEALRKSPQDNHQVNLLGSLSLLEQTRLAGVRQFVFISSVAVHHEIHPDWNGLIDETHPTWPAGAYGACKAAIEAHLKAYHHGYSMNTSAWRPAAVYGIDPNLQRSQWYELIDDARRGRTISTERGGKITHVRDIADAVALCIGDAEVAGQFYNLAERYMYWQQAAEFAREISGSSALIEDRRGPGPKNQFDTTKSVAFFDRHNHPIGLRRGLEGVRAYVGELLARMP